MLAGKAERRLAVGHEGLDDLLLKCGADDAERDDHGHGDDDRQAAAEPRQRVACEQCQRGEEHDRVIDLLGDQQQRLERHDEEAESADQSEAPDRNTGQTVVVPLSRQPEDEASGGQRPEEPSVLDIEQEEAQVEPWIGVRADFLHIFGGTGSRHAPELPEVVLHDEEDQSVERQHCQEASRHEQPLAVQSSFPDQVEGKDEDVNERHRTLDPPDEARRQTGAEVVLTPARAITLEQGEEAQGDKEGKRCVGHQAAGIVGVQRGEGEHESRQDGDPLAPEPPGDKVDEGDLAE
ncbi:MAG: hypothetical protein AW07_02735 [Candidatus Accumulibacter sp. SK-11]|nr:MAG: hypothetical protein AW07_02735 [Candidatus Accumulibacter sp. SK-11]